MKFLPELDTYSNKYNRGVVGVVAGSDQYPGAAVLCVGGARRGGAGYVKYLKQSEIAASLVLNQFPDVVLVPSVEAPADAWVIGSGLACTNVLPEAGALVLDAGALRHVQRHRDRIVVVTPHEGEAKAMGFDIAGDRRATALHMADELNVIVVLKGHRTVIAAPSGVFVEDQFGGPELSTAGTGDILAGLIGSMLASWKPANVEQAHDVVAKAVAMHGQAGAIAAKEFVPVTAMDVLAALPRVALAH